MISFLVHIFRLIFFVRAQVYVASDSSAAREVVCGIVRGAGFTAVDLGGLTAARVIEDIPVAVFPSWRVPFIINIVLFIFLYALSFAKFQVMRSTPLR